MLIIAHRINTPDALRAVPPAYAVEIDLHAYGSELVVHHDAFEKGVGFDEWLEAYQHALIVLNIKEEGIEAAVLEKMRERGISSFFLLDVSAPMLYQLTQKGERRVAVRVSSYESAQTALALAGKAEWVFLDVLSKDENFPLTQDEYQALKNAGYKLCLVSHDVWKRDATLVTRQRAFLEKNGFAVDAVLTKNPALWQI